MEFKEGDLVEKFKGDYGGPGVVIKAMMLGGKERYLVAHRIEGGFGQFVHIYNSSILRLMEKTDG